MPSRISLQLSAEEQENLGVPTYITSFMKIGSAQYMHPQGTISDDSVEKTVQILNLHTHERDKRSDTSAQYMHPQGTISDDSVEKTVQILSLDTQEHKTTEKSETDENSRTSQNITDVWAYLKGVSHRFQSNLEHLLKDDLRGREFLYSLCNVGKVDYSLISNLLIDSQVKDNPDKRIPRDLFLKWAHDLVLLIPSTNSEIWYRAYRGTSDGRQSPGGVLYQKYSNRRKTYHKIGLLTSEKKKSVSAPKAIDINPPVAQVNDILWLENNDEPRQNVIDKWIATQSYRLDIVESMGIEGYVQRFQALKRSDGYILLDIDFDTMYPGCKDNMFTKWPRTAEGIIDFAKKSTSPEVLNFLHIHNALICEGKIEILAFLILPLPLGSVRVKTTTANHKKPSRMEITDLFMLHAETLEDLQLRLQVRTQRLMESKNKCIQPFPVLCGPISNLVSSRVMINALEYNVCSPVKAIDSCFKSIFALNAKYQEGASHCWLFIEKYIYEFNRPTKKYASINRLICALTAYFAKNPRT